MADPHFHIDLYSLVALVVINNDSNLCNLFKTESSRYTSMVAVNDMH